MKTHLPLGALLQKRPELKEYLLDPIETSETSFAFEKGIRPFCDRLDELHYTWIEKALIDCSDEEKNLTLSALTPAMSEKLGCTNRQNLSPSVAHFIKGTFAKKVFKDVLPIEYARSHPLSHLSELKKPQLIKVIDYLGLRDLAKELSQVIRADIIKTLEEVLSKEKLSFVKSVMREGEPIRFAPLKLETWDGDIEKFKQTLHVRGINRLAKALYGCDPSLLWHISHHLDTGRAAILEKHCTDPKNSRAHKELITQVSTLVKEVA